MARKINQWSNLFQMSVTKYTEQLGYNSKVKLYLKECPYCDKPDIITGKYQNCDSIFIECVNCNNVLGELKIPKGYREELKK